MTKTSNLEGKAGNSVNSRSWKDRALEFLAATMLSSLALLLPSAYFVQDSRNEAWKEKEINNKIVCKAELSRARKDLVQLGDANGDGVLDIYETKSLLDRFGYEGIVQTGARIEVYSPNSGKGRVHEQGYLVRVPVGRAKSVLEEGR